MSFLDINRRRVIMEKAQLAISQALHELDLEEVILEAQVQLLRERQERRAAEAVVGDDVPVIGWRRSPRYKDGVPVVDLTLTFANLK